MNSIIFLTNLSHLSAKSITYLQCRAFCSKKIILNQITLNRSNYENLEIDWSSEMKKDKEAEKNHSVLAPILNENSVNAEPELRQTFNLAAYVTKSATLQALLKVGVNLNSIERRKGLPQFILNLDFEQNMKDHIEFLTTKAELNTEELGRFLTKNPLIFKENLDDLQTRINYLQSKQFKHEQIVQIIKKNPFWLSFSTKRIDARLGFFQKEFQLSGHNVRELAVNYSKIITYHMETIQETTFSVREEMGLDKVQAKSLLLQVPKVWLIPRLTLMDRYDFISKQMKISNEQLIGRPKVLTCRLFQLRERHGFLKFLNRAQYDPKLDMYIALDDLVLGNDEQFAQNTARSTYSEFDAFLRTL